MRSRFAILGLALVLAAGAVAQKGQVPPAEAQASAIKLISEIKWHDSLDEALAEAKESGKLVFYMHMLGQMAGDT